MSSNLNHKSYMYIKMKKKNSFAVSSCQTDESLAEMLQKVKFAQKDGIR